MNRYSLIGVAASLLIAGCASKAPSPNEAYAKDALQEVRDSMKDPTTVKFKDVTASDQAKCLYGKVLAKNSFGAYAGYSEFVYYDNETIVADKPDFGDTDALMSTDLRQYNRMLSAHNKCDEAILNIKERDTAQINIPEA